MRLMIFRIPVQWAGDLQKSDYIPTAAISTNGAELLSKTLKANPYSKIIF
jgi:hypothetical protein